MFKLSHLQRFNRRYLLVKGTIPNARQAIIDYVGILGWARASPVFMNHKLGTIVAVNRSEAHHIRAAFALAPHSLPVLAVSGTLKGVEKQLSKRTEN